MAQKNSLKRILFESLLAVSLTGCMSMDNILLKPSPVYEGQAEYQEKNIAGTVICVDEDSFPIVNEVPYGGAGGNYQYELIRIKDEKGDVYKLLSITPTSYQVGDIVELDYINRKSITFEQMYELNGFTPDHHEGHGSYSVIQHGEVKMDGLLK